MKNDDEVPLFSLDNIPVVYKEMLQGLLENGEEISSYYKCDYSLLGKYFDCLLVITNLRLISFDPIHENNYLILVGNEIEKCEIEKMYGNNIISVRVKNTIIELNRYSHSLIEEFENAKKDIYILAGKDPSAEGAHGQDIYSCPKCGKKLSGPNAFCPDCVDKRKVIRRLLSYIKPYKKTCIITIIVSFLGAVNLLIPPYLTKILIDDVLNSSDPGRVEKLTHIVLALLAIYLIYFILNKWNRMIYVKIQENIIFDLRSELFKKVQKLSMTFYNKRSTGSIMSRISSDTQKLQAFLLHLVQNIIPNLLTLISIMVIMLLMDWQLGLLALIPVPIVIFGAKIYGKKIKPKYRRLWVQASKMNATLSSTITGIKVIKAFTSEDRISNYYEDQGKEYIDTYMDVVKSQSTYSPLIQVIIMLGGLVIWGLGGLWVITSPDRISVGLLIAFISYSGRFYGPVSYFANLSDVFQTAVTSAERVFEIMDTEPEVKISKGIVPENLLGQVKFENVYFNYEKNKDILKNISMEAQSGETIGIVGSTGSGKTTLINLILRYYESTSGNIFIDGVNIKEIDLDFLRKNIGYVLQEPLLFRDTIANNIAYSNPSASIEEIIQAAQIANAHDFISSLPDAYDTFLGEGGTGLSGGEKQRLSIARAVLKNPKILVLDEATSAVDSATEKLIQDAIDRLIKNRTTFIIAHRLSTLNKAHKILVLEKGEVVEIGTKAELVASKGRFYHLLKVQGQIE